MIATEVGRIRARRRSESSTSICLNPIHGAAALLLGVLVAAGLRNILFKINPLSPTVYFVLAGLLTVVAAASYFVPARRATLVDPVQALRAE